MHSEMKRIVSYGAGYNSLTKILAEVPLRAVCINPETMRKSEKNIEMLCKR